MLTDTIILREASFNPKFKKYIFFIVLFYLFTSVIGIVIIPFWICGLGQWLSNKYFHTLTCKLTNKQLLFSKGMVFKIEKTIPLENIQDLSFFGGPFLRGLGLTFIRVETAGGGQGNQHMMSIPGVDHAEELKAMILAQREIVVNRKHSPAAEVSVSENEMLREIRDEIKGLRADLKKSFEKEK